MKQCSKCKVEQDETCFSPNRHRTSGLQSWCRSCCRLDQRRYRKTSQFKVTQSVYQQSTTRRSSALFRELLYQQTPDGRLVHQQCARRRRERLHQIDNDSRLDTKLVYERFQHQCFKCRSVHDLTIDHHYPLSKGYALSIDNAVLLCRRCNSSKGTRLPIDFYSSQELVRLFSVLSSDGSSQPRDLCY